MLAAFRARFEAEFAGRVPLAAGDGRAIIEATEIPYIPYFAFTKKVVARETGTPHRELYRAYEAISQAIVKIGLDAELLAPPRRREWADIRQIEQAEQALSAILRRHQLWLATAHADGERAVLRGRDFTRQELAGIDLSEADLTEADFTQADLRNATLAKAVMPRAVLRGAQLANARLPDADLRSADLAGAVLTAAMLNYCQLEGADLQAVDASEATWRGAFLAGARLNRANLYGCDLRNSDLTGATLLGTDLRVADLREALGVDSAELARAIVDQSTQLPSVAKQASASSSGSAQANGASAEIVAKKDQAAYPDMSEDFQFLDQRLLPQFQLLNRRAAVLRSWLRFWHAAVIGLIALNAISVASVLAVFIREKASGLQFGDAGVALPVLVTALLASASMLSSRYRRLGERSADLQLDAERLHTEYFLFLGQIGEYADPRQRRALLQRKVDSIIGDREEP